MFGRQKKIPQNIKDKILHNSESEHNYSQPIVYHNRKFSPYQLGVYYERYDFTHEKKLGL